MPVAVEGVEGVPPGDDPAGIHELERVIAGF